MSFQYFPLMKTKKRSIFCFLNKKKSKPKKLVPFNCGNVSIINFFFCGVETVVNTSNPYANATRMAENKNEPE